jgi:hypothetical protein
MGAVVKKVRKVLQEMFPAPDRIQLKERDGIIGTVVSSRFKGLEPLDRVNMIWDYLESRLSKEESSQIVIILAVTPQEELLHSH